MNSIIITCNAGSSNIKLAVYDAQSLERKERTQLGSICEALEWIDLQNNKKVACIGHRIVHGGEKFIEPTVITREVIIELKKLIPLAPLHEPQALELIISIYKLYPETTQVGCFDTAFHHTVPHLERLTTLPPAYFHEGIKRYGFHGLSYQYIASELPEYDVDAHKKRVIVAHLGGGSSMCALHKLTSSATTMGFSTLDGLMMGTRAGSIDPGIVLYLLQEKGIQPSEISNLLYNKSGLLGVSGISPDMQTLLKSKEPQAKLAIDLFCYIAAKHLGSLIAISGGLDLLVFTGGVGENSSEIRRHICQYFGWLDVQLDSNKNRKNESFISRDDSKVTVCVIPTDEEFVIARQSSIAASFY